MVLVAAADMWRIIGRGQGSTLRELLTIDDDDVVVDDD
jgi:spermidine synthase